MSTLTPGRLKAAFLSLLAARMIYAFNWYDVGPLQQPLAFEFGVPQGEISFSLWSFLFAVGVFQIPAGMLSLGIGARKTSLIGIAILGGAAAGSALVSSLWAFVVLRFLVGVGAALFFSPAMGLLTQYYEGVGRGVAFGLFNGAFSAGAAIAVFAASYLSAAIGTELILLLGGVLMLAVTLENYLVLPKVEEVRNTEKDPEDLSDILRSRVLWILALSLMGFWAANFAAAQFLVPYAENVRHLSPTISGLLDAIMVITALAGGPIGGYLASRTRNGKWLLAATAVGVALSIGVIPFVISWALWPISAVLGVLSGLLFAALYLLPTRIRSFDRETAPLSLGLINGVQVLGGSFLVLAGGYFFFGQSSYTELWVFLSVICVLPLSLLMLSSSGHRSGQTVL